MARRYRLILGLLLILGLPGPGHALDPLLPCVRATWEDDPDLPRHVVEQRCKEAWELPVPAGTVIQDRLADGSPAPAMVVIPAGTFLMGSPRSEADRDPTERQHRVWVEPFLMGRTEVTFEQYDRFARATERPLPDDEGWGRGERPVINVSWLDASAYADWLSQQTGRGYRLPTEAEWEFAARGGTTTTRWWGEEMIEGYANCAGCGSQWDRRGTAPVMSFPANPYGLFDVLGNVWEWTCSDFDRHYGGEEETCSTRGAEWFRPARGGGWRFGPAWLRAAARNGTPPETESSYIGFRLAAELED